MGHALYVSEPLPLAVALVVAAAWVGVEAFAARARLTDRDAVQDRGTKVFLDLTIYAGIVASVAIALGVNATAFPGPPLLPFTLGVAIALLGATCAPGRSWCWDPSSLESSRFARAMRSCHAGHIVSSVIPHTAAPACS
jgi:hypothetical protein